MAVVINEFEVLPEPRPAAKSDANAGAKSEGEAPEKLEPRDVQTALRQIDQQSLRVWAH
ncbi:hypothetical protein [Lysobacter sp. CA196]|uniref:hypothetical protein n=1 Tax=Lysobacter sp. CA196 TaxID=3455606 RepID=UPI003F8D04D5